MSNTNLLPCPFCGCDEVKTYQHRPRVWGTICLAGMCGAEGAHCDTEADAIAAWNRRPGSNTQQAAAAVLVAQEAKGLAKYGTTLDTAGLSLLEIATHYQQEAADALMYATAMVELMKKEANP